VPFTKHEFLEDYVSFIGKLCTAEIIIGSHAIWRSDGTKAGTKQIFATDRYISDPAIAGSNLYFDDSRDFFKSNGTAAGTVKLKSNLEANVDYGSVSVPAVLNNMLVFGGTSPAGSPVSFEIWVTDGTSAGTKSIADIRASRFSNFRNKEYFF